MNYHAANDWRSRRNLLNHNQVGTMSPFSPMHYSTCNYSTDASKKTAMQEHFGDDILLSKLHMIPIPLQKNLADTILSSPDINVKKASKTKETCNLNNMTAEMDKVGNTNDYQSTFSGITSFITGVFNVISGSFFHRQTKSETECFDKDFDVCRQTFNAWQTSNFEDLNKNGLSDDQFRSSNIDINNINQSEMINDCRSAAELCEDKLDKVRHLLTSKAVPIPPKKKPHRPRRVFVEPNSVEDNFEDAICPEDFINLSNETYSECISPCYIQKQVLQEIDAPKVKTEKTLIQKNVKVVDNNLALKERMELVSENVNNTTVVKQEVVQSCEDKLSKLKALLQEKKRKGTSLMTPESPDENILNNKNDRPLKSHKSISISKVKDKRFKNPHRMRTSKKSHFRRNMLDDMSFANEIDCDISSTENSPTIVSNSVDMLNNGFLNNGKDYFDEVSGRFHSSSLTESDDSFQIVFTDSPKSCRPRKISDCDSEDSFIVFEDSPGCYTTTDVFGNELSDYDSNCSDSDAEFSNSGCDDDMSCKLSHTLSRTVGDLTDDSLYDEGSRFGQCDSADEIDASPKNMCQEISLNAVNLVKDGTDSKGVDMNASVSTGLLMDENKKLQKINQLPKKVQFSTQPPKVHVMRVWAFAARQARAGHWERHALDRERFKRRIADVEMAVSWVLKPQHRSRIVFQRFMPWWNAQKRKELEENKKKEEEQKNSEKKNLGDEVKFVTSVEVDCKKGDIINVVNDNEVENTVVVDNKDVVNKSFGNDAKVQNINKIQSNEIVYKEMLPTNLMKKNTENNEDQISAEIDIISTKNLNTDLFEPVNVATVRDEHKSDIVNCGKNNKGCFVNGFIEMSRNKDQMHCGVDGDTKIESRSETNDKRDIDYFKGGITEKSNMCMDVQEVDPNEDSTVSKI